MVANRLPLNRTMVVTMVSNKHSLNQNQPVRAMESRYTQHIHRRAARYIRLMAMLAAFKVTRTR